MKNLRNNFKKMALTVSAILILSLGQTTMANDTVPKNPLPVEFNYVGISNDKPVFLLTINNTETDEFVINIKDQFGYVLYSEKVEGTNFSRKFLLNAEIDAVGIRVEVKSKKTNTSNVYSVKGNTRYVQDVYISKL